MTNFFRYEFGPQFPCDGCALVSLFNASLTKKPSTASIVCKVPLPVDQIFTYPFFCFALVLISVIRFRLRKTEFTVNVQLD